MSVNNLATTEEVNGAVRRGSGGLNELDIKSEIEYFLLMQRSRVVRLDGRMTVFTKESNGRILAALIPAADALIRTKKSELVKQLGPKSDIVLDPGVSPIFSPGKAMLLAELPE